MRFRQAASDAADPEACVCLCEDVECPTRKGVIQRRGGVSQNLLRFDWCPMANHNAMSWFFRHPAFDVHGGRNKLCFFNRFRALRMESFPSS